MATDKSGITQTIIDMELAINERWNRGDVDGALEAYTDDVTYFDPLTERRLDGKPAVEAYFREMFEGKLNILRNDLPNPQVIISDGGDMAVATYNLFNFVPDGAGGEKGGMTWNSTQVYRVVDGNWKVAHVHWAFTRLPAAIEGIMS
ncbi:MULTISPECIES: YybH family protein [unclassified Sphingopyxis]|uniref:YybH family protein n=1 Tax=unclassified Sphingopyxis TaxID=2614943 RepID=UPI000AE5D4DF|nr:MULTISPECIES: nuclear transport factor 2 family protein [unclassified Sphingopyxis]